MPPPLPAPDPQQETEPGSSARAHGRRHATGNLNRDSNSQPEEPERGARAVCRREDSRLGPAVVSDLPSSQSVVPPLPFPRLPQPNHSCFGEVSTASSGPAAPYRTSRKTGGSADCHDRKTHMGFAAALVLQPYT